MKRVLALPKRLWAQPGRWPRLVVIVACAVVVWMFWTNEDNAGKPDALRGGGEYLPILDRGDGHMLYLMARSMAVDFDWKFDNDLKAFGDPWGQPRNAKGDKQIPHPLGPPLIWTPLIWVAKVGASVANLFGADIPSHAYDSWHQRFVFLWSALGAIAAVLFGRRLASKYVGGAWSPTYGAVCVLLGTSVTYYATHMPSYGHALDAAACGAFLGLWGLTYGEHRWRRFIMLGAILGVAMLIRVQDVALGVVLVVEVIAHGIADKRRALVWFAGGAVVLAVALLVFTPQLYYWHVVYDDWFALPQGSRYTRLGSPMILELLFSARNGWLSTHPIAYLGVLGLFCVPRRARLIAVALGIALAIQIYLNSTIFDWWGMASFGQRRLCSVTIVLVFGLAALLWRLGQLAARLRRVPTALWHVPAVFVLGSMVIWNLWRVDDLEAGKSAPMEVEPTCCDKVPNKLRTPFDWIYRRIGNPFQLPASAWFAIKHGVDITRWDQAVGYYALVPPAHTLLDDTMYAERGGWRIGYPKSDPYLIGHWSAPHEGGGKTMRWTVSREVRVLVPNLMPYGQRYTLWLAPGGTDEVTVRWDGDIVAQVKLEPGWQPIVFDRPDMPVGEHELSIEAAPAPFAMLDGWPKPRLPVGVAVNLLDVEFLPP